MLIRKRVPNIGQVQHKASQWGFALNLIDASAGFHLAVGTVDGHRSVLRINQPAQLGSLRKVFGHLLLQRLQPVAIGPHFHDKVRTKMPEGFALTGTQLFDPGFQRPGCVGRTAGAVGENKAGGGIAGEPPAVFPGPVAQFASNFRIADASIRISWCYNDQFPFRRHFKVQIGMFRAKGGEFLVCHGRNGQGRRKECVINGERHGLSISRDRLTGENGQRELFGFDRTPDISGMSAPEIAVTVRKSECQ